MLSAEFMAFENQPTLTTPVPTNPTPKQAGFTVESGQRFISPGNRGVVTVRANATLLLDGGGLYVFDGLILESWSSLRALPFVFPGIWIFINGAGPVILRGTVIAGPSTTFFGVPSGGVVNIGAAFAGTVVAPNAQVSIENATLQIQEGSVFARRVELHQGLTWRHVAFVPNWMPQCMTYAQCN